MVLQILLVVGIVLFAGLVAYVLSSGFSLRRLFERLN